MSQLTAPQTSLPSDADFLVVGGGVVGLTIATELRRRHRGSRVVLLEKEPECGAHASGRNSGVLHAGFYYAEDSLKARFTRQGNRDLTAYCEERKLPIRRCGKLVVAQDATAERSLDLLLRRAHAYGVDLQEVSAAQARSIEPRVRTAGRALFSPTTSSVDPRAVVEALRRDAADAGVELHLGTAYVGRGRGAEVLTTAGRVGAAHLVNAAGVHADRVARQHGFSRDHAILPFRGAYLLGDEAPGWLRTHVYPVPDMRYPFLGVHFTLTVDGRVKIGPTAAPAAWREQYGGFDGFDARDLVEVVPRQISLALRAGFDFRALAIEELRKRSRAHVVGRAALLVDGMDAKRWRSWGRPGIRAQLVHLPTRRLENDFVLEGDATSTHVLNAVSPAFTCCLPFARHVADDIERRYSRCTGRERTPVVSTAST
jgi:L-2-hydroxyglutarate oxidase LhgO